MATSRPTFAQVEAEFTRKTRPLRSPLVRALDRAYRSACESRAAFKDAGANEVTFGTEVYQFAKHEILAEGRRTGVLHEYAEDQKFRFSEGNLVFACHRVGRSAWEDIAHCFPKGRGAATMMQRQLALPFADLQENKVRVLSSATRVVVAHLGNHEDGLAAVYFCIASGNAEDDKITHWAYTSRIWVRETLTQPASSNTSRETTRREPEPEVDAVLRRRAKPKSDEQKEK